MATRPPVSWSVHELLAGQLRARLAGRSRVHAVHAAGSERVVLGLEHESGAREDLHLLLLAPVPLFWLAPIARGSSAGGGFEEWLQRHLLGATLEEIDCGTSGRILRLAFASPRLSAETARTLILDPLPNACRLLILDPAGRVEQRYPPPAHARPSGRGATGEPYREPRGRFLEPWQCAYEARLLGEPEVGAAREPLSAAIAGEETGLWVCLAPRDADLPPLFLSPLPCPGTPVARPPLEAAREAGELWIRLARRRHYAQRLAQRLRREGRYLERLEGRLQDELEEASRGARLRCQAEALLAHAARVPRGAAEVTLENPARPGEMLTVRLDPELAFSVNVSKLFRRAARLERALPIRQRKREAIAGLRGALEDWRTRLAAETAQGLITTHRDLLEQPLREARQRAVRLEPALRRRWEALLRDWQALFAALARPLEPAGYAARRAETPRTPARTRAARLTAAEIHPRRFTLAGGWVVLVGRSNAENDRLTHRLARPADLWFHARGVSGSHVILRRGGGQDNPSRRTIEQAAALAAYYSKARTSSMVPVIYTERRYVRKPRKAPPGVAVCLREKVIMVEPAAPPPDPAETEATTGPDGEA